MKTDGPEQVALTVQRVGSLNFPLLNPQNQSRWKNNDVKLTKTPAHPANSAANPANLFFS